MKPIFFSIPFIFILNNTIAQTPVADTTVLQVRGRSIIYYIDGIEVNHSPLDSCKVTGIEDLRIITGGLPVIYGDIKSSIIQIDPALPIVTPVKDKKQKLEKE